MGVHSYWGRHRQQRCSTKPQCQYDNSASKPLKWGDTRRSNRTSNKFLRLIRSLDSRAVYITRTWQRLSIFPELFWTWAYQPNNNTKNDRNRKRNRYNKHLYAIATIGSILSPNVALAQGVGGVSATANPIANSSGSVTNQAIQVLQGPYITNTYGGGVQCQGSTFNATPYVQFADSRKDPWEDFYMEPQYNMVDDTGKMSEVVTTVKNYPWEPWYDNRVRTDPNDPKYDLDGDGNADRWWNDGDPMEITVDVDGPDGLPDNPGEVVWMKPVRTDMKANQNFNLGLSATLSIPLNRKLQKQCIEAAQAQIDMSTQLVANKRLDFELARLKNCGEMKQNGIMFHPKSPYASICADVVVTQARPGSLPDHTHQLGNTTSSSQTSSSADAPSQNSSEANPSSPDTDLSLSQKQLDGKGFFRGLSLPWQKPSSQEALSPSEVNPLGVWQVGQSSSQPQQSSQSSSQPVD